MYSNHKEGKSVVAVRFRRTLKGKIKKKMTTKDSKSYLGCLNKLLDQYDNLYYHSAYKKPVDTD